MNVTKSLLEKSCLTVKHASKHALNELHKFYDVVEWVSQQFRQFICFCKISISIEIPTDRGEE